MSPLITASPEALMSQAVSTAGHYYAEAEKILKDSELAVSAADVVALAALMVADFNCAMRLKVEERDLISRENRE